MAIAVWLRDLGDRVLWVLRGDRCLMLRFRRLSFMGIESAIAVNQIEISV
jgi:hypothetical protein